jgi:hypothetical protein
MKTPLLTTVTALSLLLIPTLNFSQTPAMGTSADFELFSTNGLRAELVPTTAQALVLVM